MMIVDTFYVDSSLKIFKQYFNNNFIRINKLSTAAAECPPSSDLASGAGCREGFQPDGDGEEAGGAGGAVEGEEHLGGVGAPSEEELPDPHRKHASSLSSAPGNSAHSRHQQTETSLTDSVSAVPWPPSLTSSLGTGARGATRGAPPSCPAPASSPDLAWTKGTR